MVEYDLKGSKSFFEMKDSFAKRDHDRKVSLTQLRFNLAVELMVLQDKMADKRHKERCEILGIKFIEPERNKLIANRVKILQKK